MGSSNPILHCPKCKYAISTHERELSWYDCLCPRCKEATFSEFLSLAELLSIEVANNHPEWFDEEEGE